MSDIKVKLSESGMDTPGFHDYQYYFKIHGGIEHTDFFNMLKLIKEAHEVNGALGGTHGS